MNANLELAFDVGHSSIGWSVLQAKGPQAKALSVDILGCGAVTFRADDCLASSRRAYRRQRRHIRSTRQRIARLKILLAHLGVLKKGELDQPGCWWPWQLAAEALRDGKLLSWPELWNVLRWYAHNRGYDGNRRWSTAETQDEADDTEKVEHAKTLMGQLNAKTMAETFSAYVSKYDKRMSDFQKNLLKDKPIRFKGLNAAFPREIVEREVQTILKAHTGKLKGVDANFEKALLGDWHAILCPELKLPKRYEGGLLFGQLVPRFDNRIISKCPITGEKVPSRNCREFLNFRWAMQLANIRVGKKSDRELRPLGAEERIAVDKQMRIRGYLTPKELKEAVRKIAPCERDNLDTMLMHPDAKEALLLDPVQRLETSNDFQPFWKQLPERLQKRLCGKWRHGRAFSLAQIREQLESLGDAGAFDAELQRQLDAHNSAVKKKEKQVTREELLQRHFPSKPLKLDGRAAFARRLLKQAYAEVLAGKHPKEEGGCLYITEEMRHNQLNTAIAKQTNNHLVRHRLLILERLLADIVKEYAGGNKTRVKQITIEVNRDLREMSGKTAKEKALELGSRIANHHAVAEKLEKAFEEEGTRIPVTAGLIRKARVAEDLGWRCPYTGLGFEPKDLVTRRVDKDHIVPRSERASDSLDSLVVTFSPINKWKGKRTAWQFVEQEQGKTVPDLPSLSILSLTRYRQFVEGLDSYKGHDDDKRRKKRRKELMLLPAYQEKEFVPRDLTQTSQLVRLGAQALKRAFADCKEQPVVVSLPGAVTGTIRKAWKVLGCLALANPQVMDENGEVKTKTDIRDITHLHHALDACVLGLASHFIPNNGHVWELMVKRNPNDVEKNELIALGVFGFNTEKRFEMRDLDNRLKEQIRQRLAEKRVVQHVPARMDGLRVEQTTWRVEPMENNRVPIRQRTRQTDGSLPPAKTDRLNPEKLLGLKPKRAGKLALLKGVMVISDNYGVALGKHVKVIPFHKVWHRIEDLRPVNDGHRPNVLRNGHLVQIPRGNYTGRYRILGIDDKAAGITVKIGAPDIVRRIEKPANYKTALLKTLIRDGLFVIPASLTGQNVPAQCPTTSSA